MPRALVVPEPPEQEGFDMTPMIDCAFQLILFFMLASDLARTRSDPVELPAASTASLVRNADDLVVNLLADGRAGVDGVSMGEADLERIFEARRPRAERGLGYPVVVRADRSTPFEALQRLLAMAADRGAVTRVQFAAKMEDAR
jgi:biopolymer transport protein ExbD